MYTVCAVAYTWIATAVASKFGRRACTQAAYTHARADDDAAARRVSRARKAVAAAAATGSAAIVTVEVAEVAEAAEVAAIRVVFRSVTTAGLGPAVAALPAAAAAAAVAAAAVAVAAVAVAVAAAVAAVAAAGMDAAAMAQMIAVPLISPFRHLSDDPWVGEILSRFQKMLRIQVVIQIQTLSSRGRGGIRGSYGSRLYDSRGGLAARYTTAWGPEVAAVWRLLTCAVAGAVMLVVVLALLLWVVVVVVAVVVVAAALGSGSTVAAVAVVAGSGRYLLSVDCRRHGYVPRSCNVAGSQGRFSWRGDEDDDGVSIVLLLSLLNGISPPRDLVSTTSSSIGTGFCGSGRTWAQTLCSPNERGFFLHCAERMVQVRHQYDVGRYKMAQNSAAS
ncbi:hypothetical protein VOLCADRAFT_91588 [Volvox carteri f. nagariensis]|uniref:Uncharacterized protein n=1 Tax=Volvox carteri f. nagariensis TaxID=3068 RepID=D8TXG8_VOLCA|nr:uncharacterized protein VOLCADRAFT_91588 [Volvox carteri f. nagariensis]EFJ48006.1 hypothetical protein VOLCADRAFT_91588 [Volvox carteri f. nagariensis]|eukprot:XP_002951112.1 hypothetical protein VOLCADRAFT_91588 [Volvox carteri f. nagariensis]